MGMYGDPLPMEQRPAPRRFRANLREQFLNTLTDEQKKMLSPDRLHALENVLGGDSPGTPHFGAKANERILLRIGEREQVIAEKEMTEEA